ncbi:hypothetical protein [Insolitispirillum peregrinum]|uniref:Uncharacterized protein n=1 Tax=Insolitispirillum peregrinum TaxID=80876 RepID=A0A1N7MGT8_9PROT|nr:hypothetical protein [Insolitispirillum peregrinum]SIS85325.1 hypothetical protein SAMN05421779_104115 [Insolitispirillum peregrinum]
MNDAKGSNLRVGVLPGHYLDSAPFMTIMCFSLLAVTPYLLPLLALYLVICTGVLLVSLALLRAGRLPPLHGEALVMQRKIPLLVSSALPLAVIAALLTIHPLAVAAPDGVPADWVLALAVISIQMCALEDCTATIDRLTTASGNDHTGEKDGAA